MIAPPFPPPSFSARDPNNPEDSPSYLPLKDKEAFGKLISPLVEFSEPSFSETFVKYEPINEPSNSSKAQTHERAISASPTRVESGRSPFIANSPSSKHSVLYSGTLDFSWPNNCGVGAGMANMGNTCFLNSVLQCLLHTPPLLHILIQHGRNSDPCHLKGKGFCMTCSMRNLAYESHRSRSYIVPESIYTKMHLIAKHMRRGRQEDSHELLRYAIDAFQRSCLAEHSPKVDPKLAETTWVHQLFGGRLRSRVTCRACEHNSDTFDSILDLSLDIHNASSLKEALRKFIAIDYLKGTDKYKCEKCKKFVIAEKRFTLHNAPAILTIHLKRFSPLGRKIGHLFHYDNRISLECIMSEGQAGPTYSLYGVICHSGGGPNSGHYLAHVRGRSGWYEMNDEIVTRDRGPPISLKSAYMLFYMRDQGQSLEAAIISPLRKPPIPPKITTVAACMKKKRVVLSDDEDSEDTGVQTARPFVGPLLPHVTPSSPTHDPQATQLRKKIESVQKPREVLHSLCQYTSEEDDIEDAKDGSGRPVQTPVQSSPTQPPTSPVNYLSEVPTSSFYATSSSAENVVNEKKRKSPDGPHGGVSTPKRQPFAVRSNTPASPLAFSTLNKGRLSATNPYSRVKGSNNLRTYAKRHRRPGI